MAEVQNQFRYNFGLGAATGTNENFSGQFSDPTGLGQSRYDFTSRVFPSDLGTEDNSHYMIININVPTTTGGAGKSNFGSAPLGPTEFSKVDQLRFGNIARNTPGSSNGGALTLSRGTRRIAEAVALHMPNGGLVYTEDNKYEEVSLTALAGSVLSGAAGIADKILGNGTVSSVVDAIGSVVTKGSQLAGYPINPKVEVLFSARPQRQWMFEVMLAPRSATEAQTMREIIRTLRLYAAPELTGGGFFFIPPAEFDITFYRNGVENTFLPRINTCVLERLDIDYAPSGAYSTFRTGEPVAVRMSMGFREVEILHKQRVFQGF